MIITDTAILQFDLASMTRERDILLRSIGRVLATHYETEGVHTHTVCADRYCRDDSSDQHAWPCPVARALGVS